MASVNWMKVTTQRAAALGRHMNERDRATRRHSNEHIDSSKAELNRRLRRSWTEAVERMKARTEEVDRELPPARIRADRKTACLLEFPLPEALVGSGYEHDFFRAAYLLIEQHFGKENVHGGVVHFDEVHEYFDPVEDRIRQSLPHAHVLVSCFVPGKGINGKAFETKASLRGLDTAMNELTLSQFGVNYSTGGDARKASVEDLKRATVDAEASQSLENGLFRPSNDLGR